MVRKIPHLVKVKVIRGRLNGVSRDNIAFDNQISFGSVSSIILKVKTSEILDIDLLREVALALKKGNSDLTEFASSMRLRKMLENLGLSEERIEKFLEYLSVFFYKNDDKNVENFLLQLESVYEIANNLDLSIYNIPEEIEKLNGDIRDLKNEKFILEQQVEQKRLEIKKIYETLVDTGWILPK
ncbi:MAG: hypothetical protein H0W19_09855 [Nitrosopumilus sp.]|nr:hypothetical protein [Nitrosopumilus sp.]